MKSALMLLFLLTTITSHAADSRTVECMSQDDAPAPHLKLSFPSKGQVKATLLPLDEEAGPVDLVASVQETELGRVVEVTVIRARITLELPKDMFRRRNRGVGVPLYVPRRNVVGQDLVCVPSR